MSNLPLEEVIGSNNSSRYFSSFPTPCLSGKFKIAWSTSAPSMTSSILALTVSSARSSLNFDWSSNMYRYSVTMSCFSSIDKTFHDAGHLSSFPRPSKATYYQKWNIETGFFLDPKQKNASEFRVREIVPQKTLEGNHKSEIMLINLIPDLITIIFFQKYLVI